MQIHDWFSWEGQRVCISMFSWSQVAAVSAVRHSPRLLTLLYPCVTMLEVL